eukprot:590541-Lingulodinium_polyedra.AAC.1
MVLLGYGLNDRQVLQRLAAFVVASQRTLGTEASAPPTGAASGDAFGIYAMELFAQSYSFLFFLHFMGDAVGSPL